MTTAIHTGSGDRTLKSKAIDPSAFTEIPVLDLSAAFSPDLEARKALAKELRYVCQHVGFFMVKGHRVPERVIEAAFKCAHKFFDMTMEEKMALDISKTDNFKGYTPLLGENTDPDNKGDLHESFDFGDDSPKTDVGGISSGNIWPPASQLPGFREAVNEYFGEILKLGKTLFRMFALALELPENFFEDKTTKVGSIGRLLHYPPQIGEIDEKVIGIGAHTDYECFTVLATDSVPALQVLNSAGEWVQAPPKEGHFIVNIGDSLQRWSNDLFQSTVHRAINRSGLRRYSIPAFVGVDYDVMLEALPTCVGPNNPPKYKPITAGEYVRSRLEATYGSPDRHEEKDKAKL